MSDYDLEPDEFIPLLSSTPWTKERVRDHLQDQLDVRLPKTTYALIWDRLEEQVGIEKASAAALDVVLLSAGRRLTQVLDEFERFDQVRLRTREPRIVELLFEGDDELTELGAYFFDYVAKQRTTAARHISARALVFISHSHKDLRYAKRLVTVLQGNQINTWCSDRDIKSAADWERSIRKGLQDCSWFVVIVTPSAVKAKWVRAEVNWALQHRYGQTVPVLAGDTTVGKLNLLLDTIQYVDGRGDPVMAAEEILKVIGH